MAHFVKLNENNMVIDGCVVSNAELDPENEELSGIEFLKNLFHDESVWKQTSYNAKIRFNYAGIGFTYDPVDDAFIPPKPCEHSELILTELKQWKCENSEHDPIR